MDRRCCGLTSMHYLVKGETVRLYSCVMVGLALFASASFAQEGVRNRTLKAWKEYEKVRDAYQTEMKSALAEIRKAKTAEDRKAVVKEFMAFRTKFQKVASKSRDAFAKAFATSDWNAWDADKEADLLKTGLQAVAEEAKDNGKLGLAEKAYTTFIDKLPKAKGLGSIRLALGDVLAAEGKLDAAIQTYKNSESSSAKQRLLVLGKEAPDIKSEKWIGRQPTSLAKLKGKVVVIDFWATWCGPCRVVMPSFSKLYKEYEKDGLVVIGLTRFYPSGYLPTNPKQLVRGGERVSGMDKDEFVKHLEAFRKNSGLAYPFVIGDAKDFAKYKIRGIPTVAVIGTDGKVALLTVGSNTEPLVRAAVERELKKVKN